MGRPAASERVCLEWADRAVAEYQSAAFAQHLTLWLMQIGASPELIQAGLGIVQDELAHVELCFEALTTAGGVGHPGPIPPAMLALDRDPGAPLEHDVLRAALQLHCLQGTVAMRSFSLMRDGCTVPEARAALDRVVHDEIVHRGFGWALVGWLVRANPSLRELAQVELPRLLAEQRARYESPESPLTPDERAWGLIPPESFRNILEVALVRDYFAHFEALGIDVHRAWTE